MRRLINDHSPMINAMGKIQKHEIRKNLAPAGDAPAATDRSKHA